MNASLFIVAGAVALTMQLPALNPFTALFSTLQIFFDFEVALYLIWVPASVIFGNLTLLPNFKDVAT